MDKLAKLMQDIGILWEKYRMMYLNGMLNTLGLALAATAIGCIIGLLCGILNTIPCAKNDPLPKRILLKILRVIIRIYVEVFRGTPMMLQAVFIFYALPYFTDNALRFDNIWAASILIVSINTGAYSVMEDFSQLDSLHRKILELQDELLRQDAQIKGKKSHDSVLHAKYHFEVFL